jgi:ribulose-5-phosphate 4-epimerase/fuculose-1-phosphate aldolase
MSDTKLREEICRFARSLFERGLTPGSSGNISVRLDDGGWLVTPTNASLGFLDPDRLSRLDAQGALMSGDAPAKEIPLHTAVYDTRAAARAVVHLHSTHAVALSMLPEIDTKAVLPPMTPYYLMRAVQTALIPYYRPGDPAVAGAIRGFAGKYSSVLLANQITARSSRVPPWKPPSSRSRSWKRRPSSICCSALSTRAISRRSRLTISPRHSICLCLPWIPAAAGETGEGHYRAGRQT